MQISFVQRLESIHRNIDFDIDSGDYNLIKLAHQMHSVLFGWRNSIAINIEDLKEIKNFAYENAQFGDEYFKIGQLASDILDLQASQLVPIIPGRLHSKQYMRVSFKEDDTTNPINNANYQKLCELGWEINRVVDAANAGETVDLEALRTIKVRIHSSDISNYLYNVHIPSNDKLYRDIADLVDSLLKDFKSLE